jgi:L-threonylcarbamoyladenylate synthase
MAATGKNIQRAIRLLKGGSLVAIPTETVYGLAANGLDEYAVKQIFEVKGRPFYNPLILHIGSSTDLIRYVKDIPEVAQKLVDKFWPGPLTLLLPKREVVPDIITASLPNVAIRVPNHPLTLELLKQLDLPLAAPSANLFCYISPTQIEHVQKQIGDKIPYILNGGPCEKGVESTIVGFEDGLPVIYRLGAITPEQIEAVVGTVKLNVKSANQPAAPGMLPFHYSPSTPLYLVEDINLELEACDPLETGIITFSKSPENFPENNLIILSESENLNEAASNLYSSLHAMDALNLKKIIVEKLPDIGLGKTINERLQKAAGKMSLLKENHTVDLVLS